MSRKLKGAARPSKTMQAPGAVFMRRSYMFVHFQVKKKAFLRKVCLEHCRNGDRLPVWNAAMFLKDGLGRALFGARGWSRIASCEPETVSLLKWYSGLIAHSDS